MESILEYITKRNKEVKKLREQKRERYWKLSASERIDYDNKLKNINNRLPFLFLTVSLFKAIFYGMIFFCVFNYFFGSKIDLELILTEQFIISSLLSFISLFIVIDIVVSILFGIERDRKLKELNKRFKL